MLNRQTLKEINQYIDYKNVVMLAVLGLHETIELHKTIDRTYWVNKDRQLCWIERKGKPNYIQDIIYYLSIPDLFKGDRLDRILIWGEGIINYVD